MPCYIIKFCQLILLIWKCCDRVKSCMSISGLKDTKAKTSVLWSALRIAKKNAAVSFISIKMVFQILRHIWLEIICNTSSINNVWKPQTSDGRQIGRFFTCYARKECALLLPFHLKPLPQEVEMMAEVPFPCFSLACQFVGTALGDVI